MKRRTVRALVLLMMVLIAPLAVSAQLQPQRPSHAELLCQLTNCLQPVPAGQPASPPPPPAPPPPPKITGVYDDKGPVGAITPNAEYRLHGSGFGSTPGTLYLTTPRGYHTLTVNPGEWLDTLIVAKIPEITGVPDMPGSSIYLIKAGGQQDSNLWPVNFTATREILLLPSGVPGDAVQVVSCSAADERNECNAYVSRTYAVLGYHTGWILGSNGSDVYSITLRNGWILQQSTRSYGSWPVLCLPMIGSGEASINDRGFTAGASSATLVVDWSYGFCTLMSYSYRISIIGFKGVPYQ